VIILPVEEVVKIPRMSAPDRVGPGVIPIGNIDP
jgi:hypothetical protein